MDGARRHAAAPGENKPMPEVHHNDRDAVEASIADELFALLGTGRQTEPFSARHAGFDLPAAYRVAAAVNERRRQRGERPVGRKIGFTNRTIWPEYGVWAPIWGPVWDTTQADLQPPPATVALDGLAEPRIEPEIVFGIGRTPEPGMDDAAMLGCIDWVAHGFELVQSVYPGWRFTAPDTVAAFGLHGRLHVGPRHAVAGREARWLAELPAFRIELRCDGVTADRGASSNVLDSPLAALRHLVEVLAADTAQPPLGAGEMVTTGTLTRALPVASGQTWSTVLSGIALDGIAIRFR
jgi:2-oxo-3-hexenedioate decarboxylase